MTTTTRIDKNTIIGEVIKASPEAKKIIEKHFGNGCFTCPGINMESIGFGSMMHNLDPQAIVDEINEVLGKKQSTSTLTMPGEPPGCVPGISFGQVSGIDRLAPG